jgi:hypothetical protein
MPSEIPAYIRTVLDIYNTAELQPISHAVTPLPPATSPIVVSVMRDEHVRLGDFLRHYRALGIERFGIIDNGSQDDSANFLSRQPDVDLYQNLGPYNSRLKVGWINRLIETYGRDRWFVCVDADEHIVFDGCESHRLPDLVKCAESLGFKRLRGMLVDMYRDGPLLSSVYPENTKLADSYPFFDREGYRERRVNELISRTGGPRMRVFGRIDEMFGPELSKYPIFKLRPGDFMVNSHHLWPYDLNFDMPCLLGMLHYKYIPTFASQLNRAIAEKNYWNESFEYSVHLRALEIDPNLSFYEKTKSCRYVSANDLVSAGMIARIPWSAHALPPRRRDQPHPRAIVPLVPANR